MSKKKYLRGTTATYLRKDGQAICDLEKLAKTYLNIGKIPEKFCYARAAEVALLSQAFLRYRKAWRKQNGLDQQTAKNIGRARIQND